MTRAFQPDNDPLNYRSLPSVRGTRLAKRLIPVYRAVPFPTMNVGIAVILSAASAAVWLVGIGTGGGVLGWLIFAGVTTLPLAIAIAVYLWRLAQPPEVIPPPPLASEFGTWETLTEAIGTSPHEVQVRGETVRERDHLFLGVILK